MPRTDADVAERLTRRRAVTCLLLAVAFFLSQGASLETTPDNPLPPLYSEAFYFWVALFVLLLVLATGLFRGPGVRAMLNDESTLDHRRRALGVGFWAAIATCTLLWLTTEPLTGSEAARMVVTVSGSVALVRFGWLEWKSLR
jgi:hypothetical protein